MLINSYPWGHRFGAAALLGFTLAACGGSAEPNTDRSGGLPTGRADNVVDGGVEPEPEPTAEPPKRPRPKPPEPEPDDELTDVVFVDPGCPEVPEPVEDRACEPLSEDHGCGIGMGCFPFVDYPNDPCGRESFGTRCRVQGDGEQGDACSSDACASGFLCVATGQGTQCARLCQLPGENNCPTGLVCGSVDIEGFGVCF